MQLVDQNSTLKKEAGIAERKLLARNERIQNLESLLQDADRRLSMQNQKFEAQLQAVKERLDQARGVLVLYPVFEALISDPSSQLKRSRPLPRSPLAGSPSLFVVEEALLPQVQPPFPAVAAVPRTLYQDYRTMKAGEYFQTFHFRYVSS